MAVTGIVTGEMWEQINVSRWAEGRSQGEMIAEIVAYRICVHELKNEIRMWKRRYRKKGQPKRRRR